MSEAAHSSAARSGAAHGVNPAEAADQVATEAAELAGVDLHALRDYFQDHVEGAVDAPLSAELVRGGRSNLTYRITQQTGSSGGSSATVCSWALRRPPLAHVLPTAHDMGREYRVISALSDTAVPVPRTYAHCDDSAVIGAPFYVMSWIDGRKIATASDAAQLSEGDAGAVCERLVATLAALHRVEPEVVGLGDFGRPEGYLERQVRRWYRQWENSNARPLLEVDRLRDLLAAAVPAGPAGTVVHGDYRLDNVLLAPDGPGLAAVLDWEMATLGDPLADLGLLLVYWSEPGDRKRATIPVARGVTAQPGFWSRRQVAQRYAELTGFDLSALDFYIALGCYKLAIVLEGIRARYESGAYGDEDFDDVWAGVPGLLEIGVAAMNGDGLAALAG